MRMNPKRARSRLKATLATTIVGLLPLLSLLATLAIGHDAWAEDRVILRGNYYRERSTRVLQPLVYVTKDVPDERVTLGAGYLLDAISSASIAAGAQQVTGGDAVFTEMRHETVGTVASRLEDWQLGASFRYSTETDYISRQLAVSVGRDILARSANVNLAYGYNFDRVFRIFDSTGRRLPWCGGSVEPSCETGGHGRGSNLLQVHYVRGGYSHAVHKTVLLLGTLEYAHASGPQDNPYRGGMIPNVTFETHPLRRNRVAVLAEARWHIPAARITVEPRYRFSGDDWDVQTHAIDLRLHVRILRHTRLRVRYRFYTQSEAFFWRDDNAYVESPLPCTRASPEGCASADPKMDAFLSHTPGLQLVYELDGLAKYRGLGWLEGGWIEATYNHVFQTNRYGNARMGALAFSLAF
jgi:hypothetical protein